MAEDDTQETRYVLTWRWSDNSGYAVVRVYQDEARARDDLKLAQSATDAKVYELHDIPYYRGLYERE